VVTVGIDKRLLETKEVLRRTGVSRHLFHKWLEQSLIPYYEAFEALGGNGLRYYYPPEIVGRIKEVQALRSGGKGYREIRTLLRTEGVGE
jgi:DNA-binding transcriptional MerR regulator